MSQQLSDETLAEQLWRRLRGARTEQLHWVRAAPGDDFVMFLRFARDANDFAEEVSGAGATFEHAFVQLLANLDRATFIERPEPA